jgi:hypothetical protein
LKELEISKEFGLFISLLLITAQRNSTIRLLKFESFYEEKEKDDLLYKVILAATKTQK